MTQESDVDAATRSRGTSPQETLAGRSVLVTGGAGLIGSRVASVLADRCEVTVLDDFTAGRRSAVPDAASVRRGDVRDVEAVHRAMADVDVVVHLAGFPDPGQSVRAPTECHGRTADGTLRVLDAARRRDVRVVVGSGAAVYGDAATGPVDESAPTSPTTPYGIAQLTGDQYARAYADLYGLPTVVLRYFDVYGRGLDRDHVGRFVASARAGRPLVLPGDGDATRDFVHVDDAVRATLAAAVTDHTGRAYNVGTGESTTVRAVAERVREVTGVDCPVLAGPAGQGDSDCRYASIDRAREFLGYEPTVDLDDGVRAVADGKPATPAETR